MFGDICIILGDKSRKVKHFLLILEIGSKNLSIFCHILVFRPYDPKNGGKKSGIQNNNILN